MPTAIEKQSTIYISTDTSERAIWFLSLTYDIGNPGQKEMLWSCHETHLETTVNLFSLKANH